MCIARRAVSDPFAVSVLFSEPKIPQSSTISRSLLDSARFQCSSASRKFLNLCGVAHALCRGQGFSALQRAENSSIGEVRRNKHLIIEFQCSSASRKFLNPHIQQPAQTTTRVSVLFSEPKIPQSGLPYLTPVAVARFSALQRAENSSISWFDELSAGVHKFQCSSASRKFLNRARRAYITKLSACVSVLFSEPKIPQLRCRPSRSCAG